MSSTKQLILAALVAAPLAASAAEATGPTVTFSGTADAYYTLNLSHAQDYWSPTAYLTAPTGFNLSYAKLATVATLDPVTFRLDLAFGKEGAAVGNFFVQQAFASMKFGTFTVDAGRFVTPAGFEVFEAKDNWLYSRGLIFNFAVPTAHEGVRVAVPLNEQLTLTGYIANGSDLWTNDTGATGGMNYYTGILNLAFTKDATNAYGNVFFTKRPDTGQNGFLIDAVFTQGFGAFTLNVSGDYGSFASNDPAPSYSWFALGASGKYQLSDPLKLVGRIEYLSDPDGARVFDYAGNPVSPPAGANYMSFTAGAGYLVGKNAELRGEIRLDNASEKVYRSNESTMITATLAAIAWF